MNETRRRPEGVPQAIADLCNQLADSIYIMDDAGIIRYANSAFEEMTGYASEEAVGQSTSILASGSHPAAVFGGMWEDLRAGKAFRFVFTNRKKDGSTYDEGVMISPIVDAETGRSLYVHMGRLIKFTRQSYDVFTILANSAPAGIYLEQDGVLYFVNDRLASMLAGKPQDFVGTHWADMLFDEEKERVKAYVLSAQTTKESPDLPMECRVRQKDGGERWVMASLQPIFLTGPAGASGQFNAGYVVDITASKLAEERLRNALSIQSATLDSTTDGIVVINNDREIISHNERYAEIWKIDDIIKTGAEQMRAKIYELLSDPEEFRQIVQDTWSDPGAEKTGTLALKDGRNLEFVSKPQIVDGRVAGRVWSWRDVTERKRFESALLQLANHDSLTGLMNRHKIQEELEACLSGEVSGRGALFLLDLDGFKEVNDTFGHQAGDEILVQVAHVLSESGLGSQIARFGGDEFAMLLAGVAPSQALQTAERILHRLSEADYLVSGARVQLTASMGVALYPAHATTSDELLSAADLALYEAKADEDSNLCVYSARLKNSSFLHRRGDLQAKLRDAISKGQGKLYAEKTEALQADSPAIYRLTIRMTGSRNDVLSVRDIGVLAQRASLSAALDRWLLREAISLARRPSFLSTNAGLSFEMSVHSLAHPDVLRRLLDLAALRSAHGSPMVIEFTALDALQGAESAITTLRSAGYRFKVSDTGSSELAQVLSCMPIDYVKLDRSVVRDLGAEDLVRPLLEGTIFMARRLGAAVVADGVAKDETLAALRALGVDYARGPAVATSRSANSVFRVTQRAA